MTPLGGSANWLIGLTSGQTAVILANLAVAIFGLGMLRRAVCVISGCFLILGSATIASTLIEALPANEALPVPYREAPYDGSPGERAPLDLEVPPQPAAKRGNPFDPYSGDQPTD